MFKQQVHLCLVSSVSEMLISNLQETFLKVKSQKEQINNKNTMAV